MYRLILALILSVLALSSEASPSVQATVVSGTTSCGFYLDANPVVVVTASGTTCSFDVSTVSAGSHTVQADARTTNDPIWGTQISAKSAPLNFTRPAPPAAPTTLQLVP